MKYNDYHVVISIAERKSKNQEIVDTIQSGNMENTTAEDIFNTFTGKGNLHGLKQDDYENYFLYAKAKKEIEQGQFFTPHSLCQQIIQTLRPCKEFKIADLTCGIGNFFNYLPEESNLYGNELDEKVFTVCKFLYAKAHIRKGDFIYYKPDEKFDLIVGNPPFNINTELGVSQYAYFKRSEELLKYGSIIAAIVPSSFLADAFQDARKIEWIDKHFNFIAQCHLPSDSFNAIIETKLLILQKKGVTNSNRLYDPNYFIPFDPEAIYTTYIQPIYQQNEKDSARLYLLAVQKSIQDEDLQYKIKKRLWHIKQNKDLVKKYYKPALQMLEQLKSQTQPEGMCDKEWENKKLTPEKVCHWIGKVVKKQNDPKPQKILKLVKTSYGLKLKAYHPILKSESWHKSVHDLLRTGERFKPFEKLYYRKKQKLEVLLQHFVNMPQDAAINKYLDDFVLIPKEENKPLLLFPEDPKPTIRLNDMQKKDLGLALQKPYCLLAWEQGGGKSVAGMCWMRFIEGKCKNIFVLAPALAVETTWTERLTWYGFDFIHLRSISDLETARPGQILLVSHEKLGDLKRFVKNYIKRLSYKIGLLVDESDELTNPNSQRTRTALYCFRKAKYKLLTTGTTTRNNINELYPQMELLYNNSTAFTCWAEKVYHVNKENKVEEDLNPNVGYPFPAYHGGGLFRACFCPLKSTVFGIQKDTQDVYNADLLKALINQTIITRKFEEITGDKKYTIHTHSIIQNPSERKLYEVLIKDFFRVCYDYYTSTGESRKEAALRLIRQIKVLIKASSIPHRMPNFQGDGLPGKYEAIKKLIDDWSNERVTIGTIFKDAAIDYFTVLQKHDLYRRILYIDGEYSLKKRKRILDQFQACPNAILVCTQQSLKSSVNIPYCKKCIIESLQWNIPRIAQFYFRFIRYDSVGNTEVHFVNYENTIETNLMALLMAKEKLNDFIKTTNASTTEAIYEEFGFDINILDSLLEKNYDSEGKLYLSWGIQHVA